MKMFNPNKKTSFSSAKAAIFSPTAVFFHLFCNIISILQGTHCLSAKNQQIKALIFVGFFILILLIKI